MNSMSAFGSVSLLNVDDSAGTVPGVEATSAASVSTRATCV